MPLSYLLFTRTGFWVDFFLPVLAASVIGIAADNIERRRFKRSFERYVSPEVANEILANSDKLAGTRAEVTMLISDLRNFTTMSEQMEPHQVAKHLNEYFESMTAAIFAHRGMINDFVGDSIIAVFGAPVPDPDHARHAVQCAVDMDRALAVLNERWAAAGLPLLNHGIGMHSGAVFAGNVGSAERLKYTVIGDAVNVAARLEGAEQGAQDIGAHHRGDIRTDRGHRERQGSGRVTGQRPAGTGQGLRGLGDWRRQRFGTEEEGDAMMVGRLAWLAVEWKRISAQLQAIEPVDTTSTLARVKVLFDERLYQSAREELEVAIAKDKSEPNLVYMLGHVYDRMGLREQAAAAFDVAQKLSTD